MRLLTLHTILVATDLEPSSDAALGSAARLAAGSGAALHVLHVLPASKKSGSDQKRNRETGAAMTTALHRAGVAVAKGSEPKLHVASGDAAKWIARLAGELKADAVVLGPHREPAKPSNDRPMGSTAQRVVTEASVPCLVTREPLRLPLSRVIVALDRSDTARGALLVALSWTSALRTREPRGEDTTLTALHVDTARPQDVDHMQMIRTMEHELVMLHHKAGQWAGVRVSGMAVENPDPVAGIVERATGDAAELVVLGTRGLGLDEKARLGSVSMGVARQLSVPVLLVPPAMIKRFEKSA